MKEMTTVSPQSLTSYDQVPYLANPLPQTHPARTAAIAEMFGLPYVPPKHARVLELGCASGINLLGMAHFMPDAQFTGIDLSIVQIHEAERRTKALGAENIQFLHMSLGDIGKDFGEFDYIICHGVFSWVSSELQKTILRISNENLSQEGIAFVSYNVQPGWRTKQIARDTFWALTPTNLPPHRRWEYGVAWIKDALEISAKDEKRPLLHQALASELENILTQKDFRYLVHEYLEDNNEPILFRDFLGLANEAGLAYLGDAEPASMVRHLSNPALREFFKNHPPASMAEAEQAIDIIMGRTFRQSLLVKGLRHRHINRALTPALFKNMHIQTRIAKKVDQDGNATFLHPKLGQMNAQGVGVPALEVLAGVTMPIPFSALAEKFTEISGGAKEEEFAQILFTLLGGAGIDIFASPVIADLPRGATALALLDLESGRNITSNSVGEMVAMDPVQSLLLPLLKGDWDRDEAINGLEALYAKGAFNVNPAPADDAQMKTLFGTIIDQGAAAFKSVGIVG